MFMSIPQARSFSHSRASAKITASRRPFRVSLSAVTHRVFSRKRVVVPYSSVQPFRGNHRIDAVDGLFVRMSHVRDVTSIL